jgi:Rrf2 family protein
VHISAKSDYAIRAMFMLAQEQAGDGRLLSAEALATGANLPRKFLEAILADLRRADLVDSVRGVAGGYRLARPAREVRLGSVMRAVDGPLAEVHGSRPHETAYTGVAEHLPLVWVAVRASLRRVLDEVDLAGLLTGELPDDVRRLAAEPDAWVNR